jgi:phosphoribosylamine--glycine ligase
MAKATALVLGDDSRAQSMVEALEQSLDIDTVYWYPGNAATGFVGRRPKFKLLAPITDLDAMLQLACEVDADLTMVSPELPFSYGIADKFKAAGRLILGPTRDAAKLETNKAWAKMFMQRHGIPTAPFDVCETVEQAKAAVYKRGHKCAVKGNGLANGTGVYICHTAIDTETAITKLMIDGIHGDACRIVVVEDLLIGEEISFHTLADGRHVIEFDSAGDHKREFDGDRGRNTGGMGAFAPHPLISKNPELRDLIMNEIAYPVIEGMKAERTPFNGFLYIGLMLTAEGPVVLEFNVRLGKPEAEVMLPRMRSNGYALFRVAAAGDLEHGSKVSFAGHAVGVILATQHYPEKESVRLKITGPILPFGLPLGFHVYHGTTIRIGDDIFATGGRALTVVATGTHRYPIEETYGLARQIHFEGMRYRTDIGQRAVAYLQKDTQV